MRPYEVMVIFDAAADPSAIQAVVDRTLETIRTSGGNPGTVDRWVADFSRTRSTTSARVTTS
jgi:ribosomal protein S6